MENEFTYTLAFKFWLNFLILLNMLLQYSMGYCTYSTVYSWKKICDLILLILPVSNERLLQLLQDPTVQNAKMHEYGTVERNSNGHIVSFRLYLHTHLVFIPYIPVDK